MVKLDVFKSYLLRCTFFFIRKHWVKPYSFLKNFPFRGLKFLMSNSGHFWQFSRYIRRKFANFFFPIQKVSLILEESPISFLIFRTWRGWFLINRFLIKKRALVRQHDFARTNTSAPGYVWRTKFVHFWFSAWGSLQKLSKRSNWSWKIIFVFRMTEVGCPVIKKDCTGHCPVFMPVRPSK